VARLILIRHSVSEPRPEVPAAGWHLAADGAARARDLSQLLHPDGATAVFTSFEPKAVETARALAERWGIGVVEVPGLHEHERPEATWMAHDVFERTVHDLFARPGDLVFGAETADQARLRFTRAVMRLVAEATGDIVIVTHGTVMALFVSHVTGTDPFTFWKRQAMPFAVTLRLPELTLEKTTFLSD
jgi:broad specificity phosphatase PhoE